MRLDIVTPERRLVSADVTSVVIPGSEGDLTVLGDHAPLITTLRPGVLTVESGEGTQIFAVVGGFAEITSEGTSVLAENAMPVSEVTQEILDALVAKAEEARAAATPDLVDATTKSLADLVALGSSMGITARSA